MLASAIFCILSCAFHQNPATSFPDENGSHNLFLKTNKNSYTWSQDESNFTLDIEGTLINKSLDTYYSQIGDGFEGQEQSRLFIAENSAGRVEKYNHSDSSWHEIDLAGFLIEGSKFAHRQTFTDDRYEKFIDPFYNRESS